jgi:lipopolysaccharide biosynthesis regulator YciM
MHDFWAGRLGEAEAALRDTLALNPDETIAHLFLGRVELARSNPAGALPEMERVAEREVPWARLYGLPLAYHALGREKEEAAALSELINTQGGNAASQIAGVHVARGDVDRAFEWLDKAYAQRDGGLLEGVKADPLLRSLKGDPRYQVLLKKIPLPL